MHQCHKTSRTVEELGSGSGSGLTGLNDFGTLPQILGQGLGFTGFRV